MAASNFDSPVIVDGLVTDEKLAELLGLQTEYPELDFKATLDLSKKKDEVELAKDIGAMQVRGGYIVIGVNNQGAPTGLLDDADMRPFDEANVRPKMQRRLPQDLRLSTSITERDGHRVILIYVAPHPNGCAFFTAHGRYRGNDGQEVELFRTGDVFWRNGTSSERMSQSGLEEVIARRIAAAKQDWMAEQSEIRRHELAELQTTYANRDLIEAPLGSVSVDMDSGELGRATAELLRKPDEIALTHLLNEAETRARALIGRDEVDTELGALLDKLACMGATFLMYHQKDWLDRVIDLYARIYSMPLGRHDAQSFGYATRISSTATAPRVWLQILERLFGLGALAVRREDWTTIRTLTLQHPARLTDYDRNWIRHAITMVSRAEHLSEHQEGRTIDVSLLSLARGEIANLDCLRPDGIAPDDDQVLTSLAEFDLLWNIVAVVDEDEASGRTFYPSFARVYQDRVQPTANRLLSDGSLRRSLELQDDRKLAFALKEIGDQAEREGWRYNGFDGWRDTPVGQFIAEHMPNE